MEIKSVKAFKEYSKEKFTKRVMYKEGGSTVFVLNFEPGQTLPAHKHPGTNVYILVLNGAGTFTIDGNQRELKEQDVLLIDGDEELSFENTGDQPVSLYVMLNKIPDERFAQDI